MRIFIAGASGVLSRATIRQAVARGHEVVGLVRSEDKARVVRALDAEPRIGDIFDPAFVRQAARGADAIMHLATAIPQKHRTARADWLANDRLRREGTRNLIDAARGAHIHAYIQQSVAFVYGDRDGAWVTEDQAPRPDPGLRSAVDAERMVLDAYADFGLPGVVLRGATLYAGDAWHTRALLDQVKQRQLPIIGSGEQYWHYIYVEDMARACVRAAENPAPGEIFFVADDWPFHARDFLNYLAAQLHAPPPLQMPLAPAQLFLGQRATALARSVRYRTDKIKKMLGWTPRYPTYREGFAEILTQVGVRAG